MTESQRINKTRLFLLRRVWNQRRGNLVSHLPICIKE